MCGTAQALTVNQTGVDAEDSVHGAAGNLLSKAGTPTALSLGLLGGLGGCGWSASWK